MFSRLVSPVVNAPVCNCETSVLIKDLSKLEKSHPLSHAAKLYCTMGGRHQSIGQGTSVQVEHKIRFQLS